ncbi:hypothetical protein AAIB33_15845 [Microbacterium sp. AZCO]|uniref:SCO7613 C-terminal domain-containing membrane protein n=1 Tax=Microbacterium sp. AZCO TaxID=3142976 RepID=UPI0031F3815D
MTMTQDDAAQRPAVPFELADPTRCPGCFTAITAPVCPTCGFGLTDPRAPRVLALGTQIVELESERRTLIGEIRDLVRIEAEIAAKQAEAARRNAASAAAAKEAAAVADASRRDAPVAAPHPATDATPWAAPAAVPPAPRRVRESAAPKEPRRRLTVPVLLLIVGVSLVGIAAIFFLVFAWFVWGILVRALIIGGITLAAIVSASLLRRRALTATAEGIGALGVVLLALDAWAVRANDFFGTASIDAAVYAGVATLAVGFICRVWARVSGLRGPDLAAALALPVGLGLLVGGALSFDRTEAFLAALLGASAGCLTHALPAPWSSARPGRDAVPERLVLAVIGVAALAVAALTLPLSAPRTSTVVWSVALLFVLGLAHARLLRPREGVEPLPAARPLGATAASIAVAALGLAGWLLALSSSEVVYPVLVAPVLAALVAVGADLLHARRPGIRPTWITALAAGALGVVGGAVFWGSAAVGAVVAPWSLAQADVFAPASGVDDPFLALPAAAVIAALLFCAPTLAQPGLRDARVVAGAALLLLAAARTGAPGILVATAVVIAAASTVMLIAVRARIGWVLAALVAATTAYIAGLAAPWLWIAAVVTAIAVLIAQRALLRPTGELAVITALAPVGVAAVSALIAPAALAAALSRPSGPAAGWSVSIALLQWIALIALAVAVTLPLDRLSRSALAFASSALLAVSLIWTLSAVRSGAPDDSLGGVIGEPALAVVRGGILVVVLILVALGLSRVEAPATAGAAAVVAPTLAFAVYELLVLTGTSREEWMPLPLLAAAVLVVALGALLECARGRDRALWVRLAADLGAGVTALVVVVPLRTDLFWAAFALATIGFAALSATRGWAAMPRTPDDDVFATRAAGAGLSTAARRLFAWPAVAAAVAAWWWWLGDGTPGVDYTTETAVVPAGVALVVFGALLVWLRRRGEASVAVGAGLALGLWAPAVEGWDGTPLRGVVVGLVSAAVCLVLSLPALARVRPTAVVGSTVALVGLALVAVERVVDGGSGESLWLLLLLATAFGSGLGHAAVRPAHLLSRAYADALPGAAMVVASLAVAASVPSLGVVTAAMGLLAALHVGAAAADRTPLGAVARWTSLAGAAIVGASGCLAGVLPEIEAATLPVAVALLAGAVLATLRRRAAGAVWPGSESIVWIAGLVAATVPSVVAPADPARIWTFLALTLVAAAGAAAVRVPAAWRVGIPTVLVLGGAAVAMGARSLLDPFLDSADAAALTAGLGAVAIAIVLVARSADEAPTWPATALAAAGALLVAAVVVLRSDGTLGTTAVTVLLGGAVGVAGAVLLASRRWRGIAAVLAIGGLVAAAAGCGIRFRVTAADAGLEADFWALVGGVVTVAIVLAAMRAVRSAALGVAAGVVLGLACVVYAVAIAGLLVAHADLHDERVLMTMSVLTIAGLAGALWHWRLGWALTFAAAASASVFGVFAVVAVGVSPVELVTVPPAIGGLAYGSYRLASHPTARSASSLGPWLLLLLVPSLLHDLGDSELWRVVALGVVTLALVVIGAVLRLQAPLIIGSIVLLLHGLAQLWPWITSAYTAVPWWLWLGIGGAVLIFLAATYERRVRQLKAAFVAVSSLR